MNTKVKTTRKQCSNCKGVGLVKYDMVICKYCNGIKCMFCNSTGLYKMPWDRCETCYGDGEIDVPKQEPIPKSSK